MTDDISPLYEFLDGLDVLLDDCSQDGKDEANWVRVSAVWGIPGSPTRTPSPPGAGRCRE